jgi:predicted O-methyltransferase YrrM
VSPLNRLKNCLKSALWWREEFYYLQRQVIFANNIGELKKVFGWSLDPILDREDIYDFRHPLLDINERRLRDAEVLGLVLRNAKAVTALEIGTAAGLGTALMAVNALETTIFTVNCLPEDIRKGSAGKFTTIALSREEIGRAYRDRGLSNITQIYANTKDWDFNVGSIDVAMIDGCHDTDVVYRDTLQVLQHMPAGGWIMWHDFHPGLVKRASWIRQVCQGVDRLYRDGWLRGPVFHLQDSWIGLYRKK